MYEESETPDYRRLIVFGVAIVLIVAIVWLFVWLIFFRSSAKVATPHKPASSQSQSTKSGKSNKQQTSQSSGGSGQGSSNAEGQINAPGQNATTTPGGASSSQLANTGPGNVLVPVGAATVAGSALYYVRLRKKLAPDA